jgi:hypothetical protein
MLRMGFVVFVMAHGLLLGFGGEWRTYGPKPWRA